MLGTNRDSFLIIRRNARIGQEGVENETFSPKILGRHGEVDCRLFGILGVSSTPTGILETRFHAFTQILNINDLGVKLPVPLFDLTTLSFRPSAESASHH